MAAVCRSRSGSTLVEVDLARLLEAVQIHMTCFFQMTHILKATSVNIVSMQPPVLCGSRL